MDSNSRSSSTSVHPLVRQRWALPLAWFVGWLRRLFKQSNRINVDGYPIWKDVPNVLWDGQIVVHPPCSWDGPGMPYKQATVEQYLHEGVVPVTCKGRGTFRIGIDKGRLTLDWHAGYDGHDAIPHPLGGLVFSEESIEQSGNWDDACRNDPIGVIGKPLLHGICLSNAQDHRAAIE